jgi:hypothetical protein
MLRLVCGGWRVEVGYNFPILARFEESTTSTSTSTLMIVHGLHTARCYIGEQKRENEGNCAISAAPRQTGVSAQASMRPAEALLVLVSARLAPCRQADGLPKRRRRRGTISMHRRVHVPRGHGWEVHEPGRRRCQRHAQRGEVYVRPWDRNGQQNCDDTRFTRCHSGLETLVALARRRASRHADVVLASAASEGRRTSQESWRGPVRVGNGANRSGIPSSRWILPASIWTVTFHPSSRGRCCQPLGRWIATHQISERKEAVPTLAVFASRKVLAQKYLVLGPG